ncbi:NAD(P)-dependent oxidoreductase [Thioclava sp. GXIMD2076]|uniref:NAD(P)-dependent oxidoreductase n=1 Tax=Thioclava kandeliae TaxID=3070818 RepID=A0ABV1SHH3_9RHOB
MGIRLWTLLCVGGIGSAAVPLLRGLGAVVTGVTRSSRSTAALDACLPVGTLDDVLPRTDILFSSLPLTPETKNLVSASRLGLLPRGAGVVSVGRARVIDHMALVAALREGAFGGAVLDVFPVEPLAMRPTYQNGSFNVPPTSIGSGRVHSCPILYVTDERGLLREAVTDLETQARAGEVFSRGGLPALARNRSPPR